MKSRYFSAVAVCLALSPVASALAQQGYSSEPRPAASSMHTGDAGMTQRSKGRRSLLEAITSWSPVERPSTNSSWRTSNWSNGSAPAQQSSGFLSRLRAPWSSAAPERPSPTGSVRVYQGSRPPELQEQTQPKRGFLASLFFPDPEPPRIETVNDFLKQPRPR